MSKRKAYKPKALSTEAWRIAMQGSMLLAKDDQEARIKPVAEAIEAISQGKAGKPEWQAVFDCLNMLEQFSRMPKVMRNATDWINSMQSVVISLLSRQKQKGTKALYPHELEDLRGLLSLWEEVLSTVTHREYFKAEEITHHRLTSILRSGTRGVSVVEVL